MTEYKKYGLIGYPLSHSFSPGYFAEKFRLNTIHAEYKIYPIPAINLLVDLLEKEQLSGFNVTIPYKESVLKFLDSIDDVAKEIGAVNAVKVKNGKLIGYNTDAYGFERSLTEWFSGAPHPEGALILGTGGASKACAYTLKKLNIPFQHISRKSSRHISYNAIDDQLLNAYPLIINSTPLGMYPHIDVSPAIPYHLLNQKNMLYDLVYNPEKTLFLSEGLKRSCLVKNGHDMLIFQADLSWEIWNSHEH